MSFVLARNGKNQLLEVQRLQYFLRVNDFPQVGRVDGRFGQKTETAVKAFQDKYELTATGKFNKATLSVAYDLGYTVVNEDHYEKRKGDWPPKPSGLSSPNNKWRNKNLGCFKFKQLNLKYRGDSDEIVIQSSCDSTVKDWEAYHIVTVNLPGSVALRSMRVHRAAVVPLKNLFNDWIKADLMHLIIAYAGAFNPRYKRGRSGKKGHGVKLSSDVSALSNHAFGSAFDINSRENSYGAYPAEVHQVGCVRELVPLAHKHGFFWGGYFGKRDGMHFELAKI